ncbi:MAG: hypothetical protein GWO24_12605, partial [Akkermansiaceae bacterium]|nr:hypothetical protein [Akkermansiaceae bacterium]
MRTNRFESATNPFVRLLFLAWATFKFGWRFIVGRHLSGSSGPRCVRDYIQECGGLFPKVGQLMAVRLDVIPREYEEELRNLLAQT